MNSYMRLFREQSLKTIFSNQYEAITTNPKKMFNLVCWKSLQNQSDSFWFNSNESESNRTLIDLNRMFNPWIVCLNIQFKSIQFRVESDSFELKNGFGFIRIEISDGIKMSRINFRTIFNKRIFSHWFGLIRIVSGTDSGMNRNNSD